MAEPSPDLPASLSAAQLRALYNLSLQLGPLRSPGEAAAIALDACAAMAGATAGALLWPGLEPALHGAAASAMLPGVADAAAAARACAAAGEPLITPGPIAPAQPGPTIVVGLAHGAEPGGLLLLSADGPITEAADILGAAAPLVAEALARAARYAEARIGDATRDQAVSLLAHDIRSPLVAAHASLEVSQRLLAGRDVPPSVFTALKTGLSSVRTAVELCNDMLEVKRLQAGQRIDRRPIDLARLLGDVAEMLGALAAQAGAQIGVRVEPAGLSAPGDERLLRRVLTNLAANALRFTPPQGRIELAAAPAGDGVALSVSDNGSGVAAADRERIFEPFAQGSGEVGRGAGLGLFFCRQAALAHGGAIWVEERPDGGSRFVVRLPGR